MHEPSNIKEPVKIEIRGLEAFGNFEGNRDTTSLRTHPPIKLEIARKHLDKFDDFIACACDDVYMWLVENSVESKRRPKRRLSFHD